MNNFLLKNIVLIVIALTNYTHSFAQTKEDQLSVGYIDNDSYDDTIKLVAVENGYEIQFALSSKKYVLEKSSVLENTGDVNSIQLNNKVITLYNSFMRGSNMFTFKYDNNIKKILVIGYDNDQFGNAVNDGSGRASYNMATGIYNAQWYGYSQTKEKLMKLPAIHKKRKKKIYLLENFGEKMLEEFYNIDVEYMPASIQ